VRGAADHRLTLLLAAALCASCTGGGRGEAPAPSPSSGLDATLKDPGPRRTGALGDDDRKAIYLEVLRADAAATAEGLRLFPEPDVMAKGFDDDRYQKVTKKRRSTQEALALKYRAQIAERNGLTAVALDALMQEGRQAGWPTPPPSPGGPAPASPPVS
jgi:hypothetical protein